MRLFGITYGLHTTEYIEYRNNSKEKTWRFEYTPMMDIIDRHVSELSNGDYLGIFSWKFAQKTGLNKNMLMTLLIQSERTDVYSLSPDLGKNIAGYGCFMDWSAAGHGETLRGLIKECCNYVGMVYENNPEVVVYANQFITTKRIYTVYMNDIIKPCLELLEGKLWYLANRNAGYTAGLKDLKKETGLDFYNYVPFVLERMFMQYIFNQNLKTIALI